MLQTEKIPEVPWNGTGAPPYKYPMWPLRVNKEVNSEGPFILCSLTQAASIHQEYLPTSFSFSIIIVFWFEGFLFCLFCLNALSSLQYMSSPTRPCQWNPIILITSHQGTLPTFYLFSCFSFSEPPRTSRRAASSSPAGSFQCFPLTSSIKSISGSPMALTTAYSAVSKCGYLTHPLHIKG